MKRLCGIASEVLYRAILVAVSPVSVMKVAYVLARIVLNGNRTVTVHRSWYDEVTWRISGMIGLSVKQCSSSGGPYYHLYVGWGD